MILKLHKIFIDTNIKGLFDFFPCSYENDELKLSLYYYPDFDEKDYIGKTTYKEGFSYYYQSNKTMIVTTNEKKYIETSLLSTPLSVMVCLNEMLLFHCSSIKVNNSIICFAGQSGAGKTTLLLNLCVKYGNLIFSDDSIILKQSNDSVLYNQVFPYLKITDDTAKSFGIKINKHSIYNKTILPHKFYNDQCFLKQIFIISIVKR